MRRARLACLCLAACGDAPSPRPDAGPPFEGGAIEAPGCGYAVRTGFGATAPVLAGDAVGPDPTPFQIHLGIAGDPRTSIVVTWRTRDDETERTELLLDGQPRAGLTWWYRDFAGQVMRLHEVHLCGLQPATTYGYEVPGASPTTFRTAPDLTIDPSAEVVAVALGDSRGQPEVFGQLLEMLESSDPDLILYTGDMVSDARYQWLWDPFLEAAAPILARVPFVSTPGNHGANSIVFYSLLALPGDERWFSLDYGAAHVVVVDDETTWIPDIEGKGAAFLAADLPAAPASSWRIVVNHFPLYSSTVNPHREWELLRPKWQPIIDANRVDLVLSGHDHAYERSHPLRGGVVVPTGEGTVYVTTGGAGAPLVRAGKSERTAAIARAHHAMVLRIRAGALAGTVYESGGAVIDSFALSVRTGTCCN